MTCRFNIWSISECKVFVISFLVSKGSSPNFASIIQRMYKRKLQIIPKGKPYLEQQTGTHVITDLKDLISHLIKDCCLNR